MDWDLWGPPNDLEGSDDFYCDFYCGYGFDVIEEEALNDKYCVQVLMILIKKADSEIDELEQDLLSLQRDLAWVENEEWPDVCCNALKEKIDYLDISIKKLRDNDKIDVKVHLLMYTQPVETLDELLTAVFRNFIHKKDGQRKSAIVLDFSSDAPQQATDVLDENKSVTKCNLEIIAAQKIKECCTTQTESNAISVLALKVQDKKIANPKVVKPASTDINDSILNSSELAPSHSGEKKSLSNFCPRSPVKGQAREHGLTLKKLTESSSSTADKRRHSVEMIKVEPMDNGASNSTRDASKNAAVHSYKKKQHSDSDLTEAAEEYSSISTADVVISGSVSPLKPVARKTDLMKTVKPACAIVKKANAEAVRKASLNWRKDDSDSGSGTSNQAKGSNSDMEQKLCEFSLKAAQKRTMKNSNIAPADNLVSLVSSLKTKAKKRDPVKIVKVQETDTTDAENCSFTSLLDQQDQRSKTATTLQMEKERKPMRGEIQLAAIAADEKRFNSSLSVNLLKEKAMRNTKSNRPFIDEIGFSQMAVVVSSSSSTSEGNKNRKSEVGPRNASLNQSLSGKITKKILVPNKYEVKDHGAEANGKPTSFSEPPKKKRKFVNFPCTLGTEDSTIPMGSPNFHRDKTDSASTDNLSVDESSSICESSSEVEVSLPSDKNILKGMKVVELLKIASQLKLTKVRKLRKELLVARIEEHWHSN